jgi:hypothetical protein
MIFQTSQGKCFWVIMLLFLSAVAHGLVFQRQASSPALWTGSRRQSSTTKLKSLMDEEEEEAFTFDPSRRLSDTTTSSESSSSTTTTTTEANYIDDLTPPPINLARDSILFSENPSTQRNNNSALDAWKFCKSNLPAVFTGAWPWRENEQKSLANHNPVGGLYNMAFVRLPVILIGLVYSRNLFEGHPLIMDIGDGPFAMSPLIVYLVLALILA